MKRKAVNSSNINSMGFNKKEQILEVEFKGGSIYKYFQVPLQFYQELMNAESKGKKFYEIIRGKFAYKKVV